MKSLAPTSTLYRFLAICVFILSTAVLPLMAYAAPSSFDSAPGSKFRCDLAIDTGAPSAWVFNPRLYGNEPNGVARRDIAAGIEQLRTPKEFLEFLKSLAVYEPMLKGDRWSKYIQELDLFPALERISPGYENPEAWSEVKKYIEQKSTVQGRAKGFSSDLGAWMYPVLLWLEPTRFEKFLPELKSFAADGTSFYELFESGRDLNAVNETLRQVLASLSGERKQLVIGYLKTQAASIRADAEMMSFGPGGLNFPALRRYRTHLEAVAHFLQYKDLIDLKEKLDSGSDSKLEVDVVAAVDKYFREKSKAVGDRRGGYSFSKVVEAGEIIRSELGDNLDNDGEYLEIYGSFVNGKANFSVSDIDIKISQSLFAKISGTTEKEAAKQPFSLYFEDFVSREMAPENTELKIFWEKFQKAEKLVGAKVFGRAPERPSDLLTILTPPVPFSNRASDARWYNPLTLRIYGDRVELHINDLLANPVVSKSVPLNH